MPYNRFEKRKQNTKIRYTLVKQRINEIYSQTFNGMRLDYDEVIKKVAGEFGYSESTVKKTILKS